MLSTNFHNGDEKEEDENYEDDDDDVCIFITFVLRCISFESVFIFAHFGDKQWAWKDMEQEDQLRLDLGIQLYLCLQLYLRLNSYLYFS